MRAASQSQKSTLKKKKEPATKVMTLEEIWIMYQFRRKWSVVRVFSAKRKRYF